MIPSLEARNSSAELGCFGQAANSASIAVDKFIEDNHALLSGGGSAEVADSADADEAH